MWRHHLLTFRRSVARRPLYAALNVLGLALGLAVFLILWLDVRFETSFERWIPDADQIWLVRTGFLDALASPGMDNSTDRTSGWLLEGLSADYPQLEGARLYPRPAAARQGTELVREELEAVDRNFFRVFDLPLLRGDRATALAAPGNLVLTQAKARAYFGTDDPVGRTLRLVVDGQAREFRVTGVLATPPASTDLKLDFLTPLTPQIAAAQDRMWWREWTMPRVLTFLRFKSPAEARAAQAWLDRFLSRQTCSEPTSGPADKVLKLDARPLTSLHLRDPKARAVVAALAAVGLLTALTAAVNYVNLATASAGLRAREVAVRKTLGADRRALILQFMGEAAATAAVAALIALGLTELALPFVNAMGGLSLRLDYVGSSGAGAMALAAAVAVGLGAGVYPALVLSSFQPAAVLASARAPGGGRTGGRVREALVAAQFAVAIAFLVATSVILAQVAFLRHADRGFRSDGLIVVPAFDDAALSEAQRQSLLEAWRATPGVLSVTASDSAPGTRHSFSDTFRRPGQPGLGPQVDYVDTRPGFFRTYGARLLAGRLLDPARGGGLLNVAGGSGALTPVVLNASAARALGFHSPRAAVGQTLLEPNADGGTSSWEVAGVVADLRFGPSKEPVSPALYRLRTDAIGAAAIAYAGASPDAVLGRIRASWRAIAPNAVFRAETARASLNRYAEADERQGRLFTFGAVAAVLIACVGLFGLSAFDAAQRQREIGVRKVLGASAGDVARLLAGRFLRPVLAANLIAWPLAFWTVRAWLSGFDQRIALGPLYFLAAAALAALVALVTVAGQALRAARAEPARALACE
jgi:putative ABC transport system permease protein